MKNANNTLSADFRQQTIESILSGEDVEQMLLSVMDRQNPNAELVAQMIVGRAFANNDRTLVGMIVTSSLGIVKQPNIMVGEVYSTRPDFKTYRDGESVHPEKVLVKSYNPYVNYDKAVVVIWEPKPGETKEFTMALKDLMLP